MTKKKPTTKPRPRRIIQEFDDPENEQYQTSPIPEVPFDPAGELIETAVEQLGGDDAVRMKLSLHDPGGPIYKHTYPDAAVSIAQILEEGVEPFIQRVWGGGRFITSWYQNGVLRLTRQLNISPAPGQEKKENPANGQMDVIGLMQQQLKNQNDQIIALMGREQGGSGSTVGELATAVKEVISLSPRQEQAPAEKMMDAFMKGLEFAKTMIGNSAGDGEFSMKKELFGLAKDVAPGLISMLSQQRNVTPKPAGEVVMQPNPDAPQLAPAAAAMLGQGFAYLKRKAKAGKDPLDYVDWIMGNRDEELCQELVALIVSDADPQAGFERFASLDPEIKSPVYFNFFVSIYNGVREAITAEQSGEDETSNGTEQSEQPATKANEHPGGTSGDVGDVAANGDPGKRRVK